jgi:hypothetical protein
MLQCVGKTLPLKHYGLKRGEEMSIFIFIVFTCSVILLFGMIKNLVAMQSPGVYPPKKRLRKRVEVYGAGGVILLLLGILFSLFI